MHTFDLLFLLRYIYLFLKMFVCAKIYFAITTATYNWLHVD